MAKKKTAEKTVWLRIEGSWVDDDGAHDRLIDFNPETGVIRHVGDRDCGGGYVEQETKGDFAKAAKLFSKLAKLPYKEYIWTIDDIDETVAAIGLTRVGKWKCKDGDYHDPDNVKDVS